MDYSELQAQRFARAYKKMRGVELTALHQAMDRVLENPNISSEKVSDSKGIYVYKFRCRRSHFLVAYSIKKRSRVLTWQAVGPLSSLTMTSSLQLSGDLLSISTKGLSNP